MKKLKAILAVLLILAVAFSLFACNKDNGGSSTGSGTTSGGSTGSGTTNSGTTNSGTTGGEEKEWRSYTVGNMMWLGRFLAGLSPSESMTACDGVFDTIIRLNPAKREFESDVLSDFYFEDDTTAIMVLRPDVYFSNGDHATAEDVYFSYWNHPERGSNWLQNHGIIWEESGPRDEYVTAFKLERPYPAFFERGIYLLDKKWSEEVGWDSMDWYNPVGSGPYYVYEYVNDSHIILRLRETIGETYWNSAAEPMLIDEWIMRFYPDPNALFMALQTGEVDYADIASTNYFRDAESGGGTGYKCRSIQAGSVAYFMFGFEDTDLWYNKDLRQAVAVGVNWDQVGELAFGPAFIPAQSTASTICPDFINPGKYEFNPAKSRELMEANGYGPNNRLSLYTVTMNGDFYRNAFEAIQFFMKDFYMDLDVDFADNAGAIAAWLAPGNTDCGSWYAFSGSPTGSYAMSVNEIRPNTGLTWSGIHDDAVIAQYDILTGSPDPAARREATIKLQHMLFDEIYWIPYCEWMLFDGWRTDSFTEEQVIANRGAGNYIQVGRWGRVSAWN